MVKSQQVILALVAACLVGAITLANFYGGSDHGSVELEAATPLARETQLKMSAAVKSKLKEAVKRAGVAPTMAERDDMNYELNKVAQLLAAKEVYSYADAESAKGKSDAGFRGWVEVLGDQDKREKIERLVRKQMSDRDTPYAKQIREIVPSKYRRLLPALTTRAAQKAVNTAFSKLRQMMVSAGEWNVGYIVSGHSLSADPLTFNGKYKNDASGLEKACSQACNDHTACRGYTYHPPQGVCYLKTVSGPVKGWDCKEDCWRWGKVVGHPREMALSLKDAERDLGLKVKDLKVGWGQKIRNGDTATIGYIGKLDDGTIFDQGKYVFTFGRGQVIKGDDLGLQGMRVGGRRELKIPPSLGYGKRGYGNIIPPNSNLHFEVRLDSLQNKAIASGYKSDSSPY